jgi:hypothetical protein
MAARDKEIAMGGDRVRGLRPLGLLALLLCLTGCLLAGTVGSASAAYLHPSLSETFGPEGTPLTQEDEGFGVPFGYYNTLHIDTSRHRLYVLKPYKWWGCCNGVDQPQVPRGIYAFDISKPGVHPPVGGAFPLSIPVPEGPALGVDEEEGDLYFIDGQTMFGYDSAGQPKPGFPIETSSPVGQAIQQYQGTSGNIFGATDYDAKHHIRYNLSNSDITAVNDSGAVIETFGQLPKCPYPCGSYGATYPGIAVDESTGTIYTIDDSDVPPEGYNNIGAKRGGKVRVWEPVIIPDLTTGPPSSVGHTSVTVTGHIDPAGGPGITSCSFQYGTGTGYGNGSVPCVPAASPGSPIEASTAVEANLTSLTPGTEYHYRLVAGNSNGQNLGDDETVSTQFSTVKTGEATNIARTTATLNGTADPEGEASTFYFEYGTTKSYGEAVPAPPGESIGTTTPGDQPVSTAIEGLEPQTTYHYRLVEVNSKGTSHGADRTFKSALAVKHLSTDPATAVHRTDVTLNGTLDPDGLNTHYYFEWGKTKRYGSTSAAPPGVEAVPSTPGDQHPSFLVEGLIPQTTYHYRLVAENPTYGKTFGEDRTVGTLPAVKDLVTEAATEVEPTSATLRGTLDPDGFQTNYYFRWGKTPVYGHSVPLAPGEDVGTSEPGSLPLAANLEELEPGTVYHFSLVGVNSFGTTFGQDQSFRTPQAPSIDGAFSANVTANSADLKARINPNGPDPSFETTYRFEYGPTIAYGQTAPQPEGVLPPGTSSEEVGVHLTGLEEVTYHFRVVAENQWGTTVGEDQTFTFNPPGGCPNVAIRQQTGSAYLPDCRAYELVSPERAGGVALFPIGPTSPTADDRFGFTGFFNAIPGSGEPPNAGTPFPVGDFYVASRSQTGWTTRYVGIPGNEAIGQGGVPDSVEPSNPYFILADDTMSQFLTWRSAFAYGIGSYSPYVFDNVGNPLGRLPTNREEVLGGPYSPAEEEFVGSSAASADFSHYVFSSRNVAFSPGGLTSAPGSAYDNDVATGTVTIVSRTPSGDIAQDPLAGGSSEWVRIPAVSADGSHILMSTAAPGGATSNTPAEPGAGTHLYMTVDDAVHYEVSLGEDAVNHSVAFAGMSRDGTQVFFTTAAQMTADDHDTSVDLYLWEENEGSPTLTRISQGNEGTEGNTDACGSEWAVACNVEVVPTARARAQTVDSAFAAQGGVVYFYSPEQLEGSRGVPGKRNLYVWYHGVVHHVASLDSQRGAERIDVSPNGTHAAFVTKTKVGSYDNAGHSEMYTYDPASRKLVCVSCRPDGTPPSSDVLASQNGLFMTDDGRPFFSTEDPLVERDANGIPDVYEYTDGRAQLISTGTGDNPGESERPIGLVGVSADGTNAYISTYQTLVGQDENGPFLKFYDARVNGGFPFSPPPAPCAAADECHGEGSPTPAQPKFASGAQLGAGGNFVSPETKKKKKHRKRHHRRHKHHHGRHKRHHGGGSR